LPEIPYRGYVIAASAKALDGGRWAPHTVVQWVQFGSLQSREVPTTEPISRATEEEAEEIALRIGQTWVDRVN
jgi:hypothetical protein